MRLSKAKEEQGICQMISIVFEDKAIVVCVKPSGIQSQASSDSRDMTALLNLHFKENGENAEAFPVHRLDRETAGLMVFAKSSGAAAKLSDQIAKNEIKKRYYAVVKGSLEEKEGILKDLLFRDKQKNKSFVVKKMRKGVREASLEYKVCGEKESFSLLDILLHTGRTHQIRVQFASRKHPLIGDGKYGGGAGKLALFSRSLEFAHPLSGEKLVFTALPKTGEYPWNEFEL